MKQQQKMNSRQWTLYNYIKERSLNNLVTNKEDICYQFPLLYKAEHNKNENGSFVNCASIYHDIRFINNSGEIEKIIVVDNNKIYLGTEETCREYVEKLKLKAKRLWLRASTLQTKMNLDGQGKLISCHGDVITPESKARDFVETYIKNELGIEEKEDEIKNSTM